MRNAIKCVVGKTISGVVFREGAKSPEAQVFLVFDDGTYYEIYGQSINGTAGVDKGGVEEVLAYLASFGGTVTTYPETKS